MSLFKHKKTEPEDETAVSAVYSRIPEGEFVRYMILEPGESDEPLVCTLHISFLENMPHFEAVSYVWGSDDRAFTIKCNGENIYITASLWTVLLHLRSSILPRTLWADSICIQQENAVEKGHQVSLMAQIYKAANCVVIYLGTEDQGHALKALSLISELDNMILQIAKTVTAVADSFPYPNPDTRRRIVKDGRWHSIMAMLRHPWFDRGWVVQEAGLAGNAVIFWGGIEIVWLKFVRVWSWMLRRLSGLGRAHLEHRRMSELHTILYRVRNPDETIPLFVSTTARKIDLLEVLNIGRSLTLRLASDRLYAFQAFAQEGGMASLIRPDYQASALEVFTDFACRYLALTRDLQLLHYLQHDETTIEAAVPSWVPRWDVDLAWITNVQRGMPEIKSPSFPSSTSSKFHPLIKENILTVQGVIFDEVAYVSDMVVNHSSGTSISELSSLFAFASQPHMPCVYPSEQRALAFAQALSLCRQYLHRSNTWEFWIAYIRQLNGVARLSNQEQRFVQDFHDEVLYCMEGRRFIITKRGYYGLAPFHTHVDDVCCVLFGGKTPFILRTTGKQGVFKILGDINLPAKHPKKLTSPGGLFDWLTPYGSASARDWLEDGIKEQQIHIC